MFREVYTQPFSDIRQSSVGGIEKHVRSYIILWSYLLAFKNTPKCFRNIQLRRIWRQEKEEKSSLLPYWAKFFDLLVSMYGSIIKDNKSVHLQVELRISLRWYRCSGRMVPRGAEPWYRSYRSDGTGTKCPLYTLSKGALQIVLQGTLS